MRLGKSRYSFGVDIDPEALAWGRKHRVRALKKNQRQRVALIQGDVLDTVTPLVDMLAAFNFSYWVFQERSVLLGYFQTVFDNLNADGIFVLDAFGGADSFTEVRESTEMDGFTYVWDQASYNPITGEMTCYIHFRFPDGSKLNKAFAYHWRLWTLPEVREILEEAGFRNISVWWQGWDDDEEDGDGEFERVEDADADAAWVSFIVAEK